MDKELETAGALALNRIFGYEPGISRQIVSRLGSAGALFTLSEKELDGIFGPYSKYHGAVSPRALDDAVSELRSLRLQGMDFIAGTDPAFPALLGECEDPPAGLYVRSSTPPDELFGRTPCIAVVGTRDISPYGREWCGRIVRTLSEAPVRPVIVSGLAMGVDVTAHSAALEEGLPTIAVIPVGIDDIYPKRHRTIAERMAGTPGCAIVSDYPPGTAPLPFNFLRRNRIIAGLSTATILVESKSKGGGTMTAGLASGYGRDVFALPGRIDDARSAGCNRLIAQKVAEPVFPLEALPDQLGLGHFHRSRRTDLAAEIRRRFEGSGRTEDLLLVAETVKSMRGIDPDGLSRVTGLPYSDVIFLAGMLENGGIIVTDLLQRCSINGKIS